MNIISAASALRMDVEQRLPAATTSLFREAMLPELWGAAVAYGIDPVGMVAQAGKETGWGSYTGNVKPWFYNTAGIKVRHVSSVMGLLGTTNEDHPLVHQQFSNWTVGAVAHAQHLVAYTGGTATGLIVDPRYTLVVPPFVETWAGLGGRWAPSPTYGLELEALITQLRSDRGLA